ncbi:MAG TPA: hypothetical protein DCS43_02045 [Verrucomicrobia bacterium]|nr:hypothetical protein [Verrucomicrobiota bacterium]
MAGRRGQSVEEKKAMRRTALSGHPHCLPAVRKEEKDGKLYVTVKYMRPRWQRLMGGAETCERTFGMDAYGRRVYELCDGRQTVESIVQRFATAVRVSLPESEMAVTKFMRTLLTKGLIAMEMKS